MNGPAPTRYALLRDRLVWEGVTATFLQQAPDGALTLRRVPGPANGQGIEIAGPYEVAASGLATAGCDSLFVADTNGSRVLYLDGLCAARAVLPPQGGAGSAPGQFRAPRGLLATPDALYVADSGNARVQVFRFPTLEARAAWTGPLRNPTGLTADGKGRIYVLDRALRRILRFDARGLADDVYNGRMAAHADLTSPAFLAVAPDDILFVSDDAADAMLRFDPDGNALGPLPASPPGGRLRPRALGVHADRLYVADAQSGRILVFDPASGEYQGALPGYRGPVTALALDADGNLYLKPGLDDRYFRLAADAAFVPEGRLQAGPLDAGNQTEWERIAVEVELPRRTAARLQAYATNDVPQPPGEADWIDAAALDTLVPSPGRYLYLRLFLSSASPTASPRLLQVRAETPSESYLQYLPAIYRREDAGTGSLQRLLALFRTELGGLEEKLEAMAARFAPAFAPPDGLDWLSSWLAFPFPPGLGVEERRVLLLRVFALYDRRGTPLGLRELVHLYTGIRPSIVEGFEERHVWQLGVTSALGFDTALAPAAVGGMVLPDSAILGDSSPAWGCAEPERLVVGETVVGQSGPLSPGDLGEPLFADTAHRFTVLVPAAQAPEPALLEAVREVIEAEKPAHTDYHLCLVEARMRVGFQARIGVDSIVAGPPEPMALSGAWLDQDAVLGGETAARIGGRTLLGENTVLE